MEFVLSASKFDTIKKAEEIVNKWWVNGTLDNENLKLYKITEVYNLKLKFSKEKK